MYRKKKDFASFHRALFSSPARLLMHRGDRLTRLLYRIAQVFREASLPRDTTTMLPHIDRKSLDQLRAKKLALGQRPGDHDSQDFSIGSMSMI